MKWLKNIYDKVKKPVEWIEIPIPDFMKKKEGDEDKSDEEDEKSREEE